MRDGRRREATRREASSRAGSRIGVSSQGGAGCFVVNSSFAVRGSRCRSEEWERRDLQHHIRPTVRRKRSSVIVPSGYQRTVRREESSSERRASASPCAKSLRAVGRSSRRSSHPRSRWRPRQDRVAVPANLRRDLPTGKTRGARQTGRTIRRGDGSRPALVRGTPWRSPPDHRPWAANALRRGQRRLLILDSAGVEVPPRRHSAFDA